MFDPHRLTNMQSITKKPKIPTPELCTADAKWGEANKLDTWAIDVLDYLMVHHIRLEDEEALPYAAGYLGELAKEFMSTWRNDPLNENMKLRSFLNDLRAFYIPTNYKDKLWEEFNSVEQRGRLQGYGILLHSHTDYCLLFSSYHMFIIFVISY